MQACQINAARPKEADESEETRKLCLAEKLSSTKCTQTSLSGRGVTGRVMFLMVAATIGFSIIQAGKSH